MTKLNLTVYKIRNAIAGTPITQSSDILKDSSGIFEYPVPAQVGFDGVLYVSRTGLKRPKWTDFIETGVGAVSQFQRQRNYCALLVIRTQIQNQSHFFAIAFGSGARFLMKPGAYENDFGLKIALNTIYAESNESGSTPDHSRIRSVNAKTISSETFNSTIQASRRTNFEAFELDTSGDQLRSITGRPLEEQVWGTRITGGPAVNTQFSGTFSGLESLCHRLQTAFEGNAYQQDFGWIDNIKVVQDSALRGALNDLLIESLTNGAQNLEIVPIRVLAWEEISSFQLTGTQGGPIDMEDPENLLAHFLERLSSTNRLDSLSLARLKNYRINIIDVNDDLIEHSPLFNCIEGELSFNNRTYLISEGDYFEINLPYLQELNSYVDNITSYSGTLPDSTETESEGDYNERAANSSDQLLMLDRATVRIPGKTTPIEICDILTRNGKFIHAKRKLGSSALSHLFAQGEVSADLFVMSPEYRTEVRAKIDEMVAQRQITSPGFPDNFLSFDPISSPSENLEVVYAIIAKWNGRSFSNAIPFFSKVNLRRTCLELRKMGFNFSICPVEAVSVP